jgi:hypothetical protein
MSCHRTLLSIFLVLLLVACGSAPKPVAVDRGDLAQVSLVAGGQAGERLAHPARVDEARLRTILAGLNFEERSALSRPRPNPVFDPREIDELAPRLATALATARPDQRVAFVSLVPGASATSGTRKTEGTLFVAADGRLNLAFAGIHHLMTVDDDFTRFREISLGDPLRATRSLIRLSPAQGLVEPVRQDGGDPYPMWVSANLASISARTPAPAAAEPAPARPSETRPSQAAEPAPTRQPPPAEPETGSLAPDQVRERLEFLKSLHEEGLISDQEYEQERQRILRRLD